METPLFLLGCFTLRFNDCDSIMPVNHNSRGTILEISIPEEVSLCLRPRQFELPSNLESDDEASTTSEISLEFLSNGEMKRQLKVRIPRSVGIQTVPTIHSTYY